MTTYDIIDLAFSIFVALVAVWVLAAVVDLIHAMRAYFQARARFWSARARQEGAPWEGAP